MAIKSRKLIKGRFAENSVMQPLKIKSYIVSDATATESFRWPKTGQSQFRSLTFACPPCHSGEISMFRAVAGDNSKSDTAAARCGEKSVARTSAVARKREIRAGRLSRFRKRSRETDQPSVNYSRVRAAAAASRSPISRACVSFVRALLPAESKIASV